MGSLDALIAFLRESFADVRSLRVRDFQFWHGETAELALLVAIGVTITMLVVRATLAGRRPGRDGLTLPALLGWAGSSRLAVARFGTLGLFLLGLPFFAISLADPFASLIREDVTFPGRRIGLLIDASPSMTAPFEAPQLHKQAPSAESLRAMGLLADEGPRSKADAAKPTSATFFTSVATAEYFIKRRIAGKYRDLMALVEFGDEAYVITPFTSDYENILLSTSLISDSTEWKMFPDKGTNISKALDQGVGLFRAFNFLDASGNLMIIMSDGQDTDILNQRKSVGEVMERAVKAKIPVFFIRIRYNKELGANIPDVMWKEVVESTGGRFYAAADEESILRAVKEIDDISVGQISVKQYSMQRSRFAVYGVTAASLWSIALLMQLTVPYFSKFP